jgi:hypothetical protein
MVKVYYPDPVAAIVYKATRFFGLFSWWTCEFFWDWDAADKRHLYLRTAGKEGVSLFGMTYQKIKSHNNQARRSE